MCIFKPFNKIQLTELIIKFEMSSELDQKRPLSPQQLFQRLISGDFTEIECIDQVAQVKQQRQILISLITEYRLEISKKMDQYRKLQEFLQIRNKLRSQLEVLRQDRISIDKNIQYELNSNRISHTQVADISVRRAEIDQIRFKNAGLQGRLRQLSQYCLKIERHNQILQQQKRMGMEYEMRTRSNSDLVYSIGCNCDGGHRGHGGCGWGQRYSAIKTQQQNLTTNMMRKIREKEQQNIKHVRMQQQQIAQRNRRKMQAFHERMRKYH